MLGASSLSGLAALPDQQIAQAIVDGGFGSSTSPARSCIVPPARRGTLPLGRVTFLFFGQRLRRSTRPCFSDVVFDRVAAGRFAADAPEPARRRLRARSETAQAAPLLAPELGSYPSYPGALHDARMLVDAHGDGFLGANLYGNWLSALRALRSSPPSWRRDGGRRHARGREHRRPGGGGY